jgi:hypothetical protein
MRRRGMVAAVAVSFLALSSSVAGADQLKDDTNGLVAGDQDGIVNKTLAAGASGSVNIGAWVNDAGQAVTFPIAVSIAESQDNSGIVSGFSDSSDTIGGYDPANGWYTDVNLVAPSSGLTCGEDNLFIAKVQFSSPAADLNPASAEVSIHLTVPGPACTAANAAPAVDAGGPYSGAEGSASALDGAAAVDPDGDPLAYSWTYAAGGDVDAGATCAFSDATALQPTISCTDDGTYTATLSVDDGVNAPVTDDATVNVTNAAPVVGAVSVTATAACSVDVSAGFTDDGANDTHSSSIDWGDGAGTDDADPDTTPVTGSHTYTSAGTKTITVAVTDDDAGQDSGTGSFTTLNTPGAFLPPINTTGNRSTFKVGSTIPVKITVTDCAGALVTNLSPVVHLQQFDGTAPSSVNETVISEVPTNGKNMRWDGSQYIYNLSTKNSQFNGGAALTTGTYRIWVTDPSFFAPAAIDAYFDLKR